MKRQQADILYFAYGSNLSIAQMKRRCPSSKFLRKAVLKGYRLSFYRYSSSWSGGVADVVKDHRENVWGLVYTLTRADLTKLDGYEGYPTMYRRKLITVFGVNGQPTKNVWVYYIVNKGSKSAPSKQYIGIIKAAAHNYNFPRYYREMLKSTPVRTKVKTIANYQTLLLKDRKPIFGRGRKKLDASSIVHLPHQDRTYLLEDDQLWEEENRVDDVYDQMLNPERMGELPFINGDYDPDNLFYD